MNCGSQAFSTHYETNSQMRSHCGGDVIGNPARAALSASVAVILDARGMLAALRKSVLHDPTTPEGREELIRWRVAEEVVETDE